MSKTELLKQLLKQSGFDSPKHAINYAKKSSEQFKNARSDEQYSALTRAVWNSKATTKQELVQAMLARLQNKPKPKRYAKKSPQELEDLGTTLIEKNKNLDELRDTSIDDEYQDLIDSYNSRIFDREAEDLLLEQERTAPSSVRHIEDFDKTPKKFTQPSKALDDLITKTINSGEFIRNKRTIPDIDALIDTTTEVKSPHFAKTTVMEAAKKLKDDYNNPKDIKALLRKDNAISNAIKNYLSMGPSQQKQVDLLAGLYDNPDSWFRYNKKFINSQLKTFKDYMDELDEY